MLSASFPGKKPEITLVAHSMGGLVARAALLQKGDLNMVKRLIMLGTPNHGSLQTARLGLLAAMVREASGVLWSVFARHSTGILELTQPGKTFAPLLSDGAERTRNVQYVTIPAMRFHSESEPFERLQDDSPGLWGLQIIFEMSKCLPGLSVALDRPNDGIVEARCVMLSSQADYFSERNPGKRTVGPYLHVTHGDYKKVDHAHIHSVDVTFKLLRALLKSLDLETWRETLEAHDGALTFYPTGTDAPAERVRPHGPDARQAGGRETPR
jgi:hypothetical protein